MHLCAPLGPESQNSSRSFGIISFPGATSALFREDSRLASREIRNDATDNG